ncbi:MAG: DJ-1 family glyoxalase III [Candidatus Cryptobacteroides sp.]
MNYIFLADGFEIVEAMAPVDVITRAGIPIKTVSVTQDHIVSSSHGITVGADFNWDDFKAALAEEELRADDILIFPGGMPGSVNLSEKAELMDILQKHFGRGGNVAAICAAPSVVLGRLDGICDRKMCCYQGFEQALLEKGAQVDMDNGVVIDRNMVTSRGAGHAIAFGLAIVSLLRGQAQADKVAGAIML